MSEETEEPPVEPSERTKKRAELMKRAQELCSGCAAGKPLEKVNGLYVHFGGVFCKAGEIHEELDAIR
jgi:hypothetical protein